MHPLFMCLTFLWLDWLAYIREKKFFLDHVQVTKHLIMTAI